MGTFSTKAASALDKVLRRKTLLQIKAVIRTLETELDQIEAQTASIEQQADRILDVQKYADGSEKYDKGRLEYNLTQNLDGPSITRAISTATSVFNLVTDKREAWKLEQKAEHDAKDPYRRWDESWLVKHGPGVVPKDNPI